MNIDKNHFLKDPNYLLEIISRANTVLMDAHDSDHEHTIKCHEADVAESFRREALAVENAIKILQTVIHQMCDL